jgi:hypothetical protein
MKLQRIALLCAAGTVMAACSSDTGPKVADLGPHASVRYVNAIPDTNKTDFKFVDQMNGSPYFGQLAFRDISAYQPVAAGARHIRIFSVDPRIDAGTANEADPNVVSQTFVDTTITFEAGKFYTIIHGGYARAGGSPKQHLIVLTDDRATAPSTSQIAARVINAAPTLASADVYTGTTATGGATFSSLTFGSSSAYKLLNTGTLAFTATSTGSTTVAASASAPVGAPPVSVAQSATGGYSIGGSMLTAFMFSPAVAGSLAPTVGPCSVGAAAKCVAAGVLWMQDNFPQLPGGA